MLSRVLAIASILITLISCNKLSRPAEEEVKKQINILYANAPVEDVVSGKYKYIKEFATLEDIKIVDRMINGNQARVVVVLTFKYKHGYKRGSYIYRLVSEYLNDEAKEGQSAALQREFIFLKYESGWRLNSMK